MPKGQNLWLSSRRTPANRSALKPFSTECTGDFVSGCGAYTSHFSIPKLWHQMFTEMSDGTRKRLWNRQRRSFARILYFNCKRLYMNSRKTTHGTPKFVEETGTDGLQIWSMYAIFWLVKNVCPSAIFITRSFFLDISRQWALSWARLILYNFTYRAWSRKTTRPANYYEYVLLYQASKAAWYEIWNVTTYRHITIHQNTFPQVSSQKAPKFAWYDEWYCDPLM